MNCSSGASHGNRTYTIGRVSDNSTTKLNPYVDALITYMSLFCLNRLLLEFFSHICTKWKNCTICQNI